jgi:hypothetical protein
MDMFFDYICSCFTTFMEQQQMPHGATIHVRGDTDFERQYVREHKAEIEARCHCKLVIALPGETPIVLPDALQRE